MENSGNKQRRFYVRDLGGTPEGCVYYTFSEGSNGTFNWRAGWSFRHCKDAPNKQVSRKVAESRWALKPIVGTSVGTDLHIVRADILRALSEKKLNPRRLNRIVNDYIYYNSLPKEDV